MPRHTALTDLLTDSVGDRSPFPQDTQVSLTTSGDSLSWEFPTAFGEVTVRATQIPAGLRLTCHGSGDENRRVLRNVLVTDALLKAAPKEHHELEVLSGRRATRRAALTTVAGWVSFICSRMQTVSQVEHGETPDEDIIRGFWWDRKANFGDAIGPWIVSTMTGRHVVNVRSTKDSPIPAVGRASALVGSIVQMINRPRVDIWGSGLMRPLSEDSGLRRRRTTEVHAVRGHLTRHELQEKLGWTVPEVYGDPALLLPRLFTPNSPDGDRRIAFVPHMKHRTRFSTIDEAVFDVCDVRDDLTTVVSQIAGARACVSTSMHGLIVAQAYGVPWVWLNISDAPLGGADFKFEDFFSTLDSSSLPGGAPARVDVTSADLENLDLQAIAEKAALPSTAIDLDALEAALPHRTLADERLRQRVDRRAARRMKQAVRKLLPSRHHS
ncbi:polysaccharide pyruvyl transferase family protein [Nesterenkonia lacusekhoensis]|uniref:polysaccharide pyruvyl transferase family protein n=1 Tax=Nesterenkonia lacusekhoensis TaxID=150832 RepID=UPI00336DE5E8